MRVLVTGAAGFVGRALVERLRGEAEPSSRLVALDRSFAQAPAAWRDDARLELVEGDFGDAAVLDHALAEPPARVFHLASIPGSLAEREPALGLRVNLLASIELLTRLAALPRAPRLVFASSVAVYGALPADGAIDEDQPLAPLLSYGAHKQMLEVLIADASRRGEIDGISLRLPGIVARPAQPSGHGSAFMSELIRRTAAGERYDCPVSAEARCWWMSLPCCIDNLLHAATLAPQRLAASRAVQLPVLSATTGEVAAAAAHGRGVLPQWRSEPAIEALFGRMPPLHTPRARALGFACDGDLARLVRRAL
ncbi:MAG TPA: NAD-dependent epimerase/dehydratase family protein [Methylibium sp.]|uniref:NAD-dependent epimerase/dehydratase family protein n=1 Tax=Methylibium sp. TaxID=2067992 RepID=UPI002DB59657|nr:NAD-dependent epimerase/dehydratase family protein [Methylibium sp.]HEU4460040.1 NAD-dependent epimerase/dehydratase family protein [Methylibium sp.]